MGKASRKKSPPKKGQRTATEPAPQARRQGPPPPPRLGVDANPRAVLVASGLSLIVMVSIFGAAGWFDSGRLTGGAAAQAPRLLPALLGWILLSGAAVVTLTLTRKHSVLSAVVGAALALPPLYTLFMANPEFLPPLFDGMWSRFAGLPTVLAAVVTTAGLHTLRCRPGSRNGQIATVAGLLALAAALLAPWHDQRGWTLPLVGILVDSIEATPAALGRALVAVMVATAVVLGLLSTLSTGGRPDQTRAVWRDLSLLLTALAYPVWILAFGFDLAAQHTTRPAVPVLLLSPIVAVFFLWLAMGLRRLFEALDQSSDERSLAWQRSLKWGPSTAWWAVVVLVFALFFLLKTHGLRASTTDENIYFYGAHLMTRGVLPYRDFFFAHPPLHLVVPAALFKVFGFDLTFAKLIPAVATMISGGFVLAIGHRHMGKLGGFAALVAFLFANEVLKASTNMTGINLTTMWLSAGLWAVLSRRWITAGVMLGLSVCTGFYAIAAALALVVLTAFAGLRPLLRIGLAFFGVAGAINGIFWNIGGDPYIEGVYRYHSQKAGKELAGELLKATHYHPLPFWAFFAAQVAAVLRRIPSATTDKRETRSTPLALLDPRSLHESGADNALRVVWLMNLALLVEFMMFKELYAFYFVLWFPGLALLVGYLVTALRDAVFDAATASMEGRNWRRRAVVATGILVLACAWLPFGVAAESSVRARENERIEEARKKGGDKAAQRQLKRSGFTSEYEQRGEKTKHFDWYEPPLLPELGDVVKVLFWRGERTKGARQPGYAWYLQSKKRYFEKAQDIADYVRENTADGETITGASGVAPLIALLSGRDLAGRMVDTNNKVFKSGMLSRQDYFERICEDRVRFVVSASRSAFSIASRSDQALMKQPTIRKQFKMAQRFDDTKLRWWKTSSIYLVKREDIDGQASCRYLAPPANAKAQSRKKKGR